MMVPLFLISIIVGRRKLAPGEVIEVCNNQPSNLYVPGTSLLYRKKIKQTWSKKKFTQIVRVELPSQSYSLVVIDPS